MNVNKIVIGGTFLYVGSMFFFLLAQFFSQYKQLLQTIGVIHLIIGGIITIFGMLSKDKKLEALQPPTERKCLNCGEMIPYEASICPYCKYDFTQVKIGLQKKLQDL
jgi:Flp pilus assembly protein protease CpaA